MSTPSIPNFNGEIKTPWRWYNSLGRLAQYRRECGTLSDCPFSLIWQSDSLPPFQFVRPASMSPITSWMLYDGPGEDATMVYDLAADIDLLNIFQATGYDYITYNAEVLGATLDAGVYYARIVTAGVTYYSEPVKVVCTTYSVNVLPDPAFGGGLLSTDGNPDAVWYAAFFAKILCGTKNTAGAPVTPECEYEGALVANFNDNLLYTYTSGSWVSSTPSTSTGWYDSVSGNWYRFNAGAWQGLASPIIELDENGACWDGTNAITGIAMNIGALGTCTEVIMQFEFTVTGMTTGFLGVGVDGYGGLVVSENGTYTFSTYVANGYLLSFLASGGFDGCISAATMKCPAQLSDCYYRLTWTNCGNVGTMYLGSGLLNQVWFDQSIYPVVPETNLLIDRKERADGSTVIQSRRKETTWTMDLGFIPWYAADALTEMALHDTIKLYRVGGGFDTLTDVSVSAEWEEDFGACLAYVVITFQIGATALACCDVFTPPCRISCISALGFEADIPPTPIEGTIWLSDDTSVFFVIDADGQGVPYPCANGLAEIADDEAIMLYAVYFDLNAQEWFAVAVIVDINITPDGLGGCTQNIIAVVAPGYVGTLQYLNTDDEWQDDDSQVFDANGWITNVTERVTPANEGAGKLLRIKVSIGDCVLGYSAEATYSCA